MSDDTKNGAFGKALRIEIIVIGVRQCLNALLLAAAKKCDFFALRSSSPKLVVVCSGFISSAFGIIFDTVLELDIRHRNYVCIATMSLRAFI